MTTPSGGHTWKLWWFHTVLASLAPMSPFSRLSSHVFLNFFKSLSQLAGLLNTVHDSGQVCTSDCLSVPRSGQTQMLMYPMLMVSLPKRLSSSKLQNSKSFHPKPTGLCKLGDSRRHTASRETSMEQLGSRSLGVTVSLSERVKSPSCVQLFATPWTVAYQAPPSMEFSRQEYWNGLPLLSPGIFPTQGSNPGLPHCRQTLYYLSHQGSPVYPYPLEDVGCACVCVCVCVYVYVYVLRGGVFLFSFFLSPSLQNSKVSACLFSVLQCNL